MKRLIHAAETTHEEYLDLFDRYSKKLPYEDIVEGHKAFNLLHRRALQNCLDSFNKEYSKANLEIGRILVEDEDGYEYCFLQVL